MWVGFPAIVLVMLAIDLFVVGGGKQHRVSMREAAAWSMVWAGVSSAFAGTLWWYLDDAAGRAVANKTALEFVTGDLIEKSLAVDSVFVWLMLFSLFAVPLELQRRVLIYGVLGAIVLMFVGVKMMLIDVFKIPVLISLGVVATIIAIAIILSLRKDAHERLATPVTDSPST